MTDRKLSPTVKMALILSGLYVGAQLVADVAASKIFMLAGLAMPAGK